MSDTKPVLAEAVEKASKKLKIRKDIELCVSTGICPYCSGDLIESEKKYMDYIKYNCTCGEFFYRLKPYSEEEDY